MKSYNDMVSVCMDVNLNKILSHRNNIRKLRASIDEEERLIKIINKED
jgi:hypothetical protein